MTREEAFELIPLYAVGVLDREEAHAVEDFMRDASAEERHELSEWRDVVSMLPLALPEIAPPERLKARLLDRIAEDSEDQETQLLYRIVDSKAAPVVESPAKVLPFTSARKFETSPQRWLLMAATVLLALTSAFLVWRNGYVAAQRDAITAERDRVAAELERAKKEREEIYASLTAASKIVPMAGDETPQANAKVIWDMKQQVWKIFIVNLPPPPSGKDYQLWYVTNKNQKISASVFSTDSSGNTVLTLTLPPQALTGLAATAVTLEPKGGSPQPTGKFYLKAAI